MGLAEVSIACHARWLQRKNVGNRIGLLTPPSIYRSPEQFPPVGMARPCGRVWRGLPRVAGCPPRSNRAGFEPFDLPLFDSEVDSAAADTQAQTPPAVPDDLHQSSPRGLPTDTLDLESTIRATLPDSTLRDSVRLSTGAKPREVPAESTYVVYLDSAARLRQFTHMRTDEPQVRILGDRPYTLYAANRAATYRREMSIDSATGAVRFRETVAGAETRIPVSLSLKQYLAQRRAYELRKMLADEVRKPKAISTKRDIGELLSDITQIQIPMPPNPILSIFGKPEIKLNISGAVDIKAGFPKHQI